MTTSDWTPTEADFLARVKDHTVEVLRDDGLYRHVRFSRNGSSIDHFDLITWPGYLAYVGDMGSFVFSRLPDMFEFFRGTASGPLRTNPGYWGEKLQAVEKHEGFECFNADRFREVVNEYRVEWVKDAARSGALDKGQRRELWEAVGDEVIPRIEDGAHLAMDAATSFEHRVNGRTYRFDDLWDHHFEKFTGRFLWCCYAIAWGIRLYDKRAA